MWRSGCRISGTCTGVTINSAAPGTQGMYLSIKHVEERRALSLELSPPTCSSRLWLWGIMHVQHVRKTKDDGSEGHRLTRYKGGSRCKTEVHWVVKWGLEAEGTWKAWVSWSSHSSFIVTLIKFSFPPLNIIAGTVQKSSTLIKA